MPPRDVGLSEEDLRGPLILSNQVVEIFDLVAECVVDRLRIELAWLMERAQIESLSKKDLSPAGE